MKAFGGKVLFLDRDNINTDEIIPAKYLTASSKSALKKYCLEDLKLPSSSGKEMVLDDYQVIVTRANFGCGSSREHAAWALEENGITLVLGESFARIFRQNMFNGGMIALEISKDRADYLFSLSTSGSVTCEVDFKNKQILFLSDSGKYSIPLELSPFDNALVKAGGWVAFADARY